MIGRGGGVTATDLAGRPAPATLVPFSGWWCINCQGRTPGENPDMECCPDPLPFRVLVERPDRRERER